MDLNLEKRIDFFCKLIKKIEISHGGNFLEISDGMNLFFNFFDKLKKSNGSLYIIGNGGSAGVAGHAVTDFFNVAAIKATTLHESSLMTCFANDYGYENVFSRQVDQLLTDKDILVAISSSGKSLNIRNAVEVANAKHVKTITLSGFNSDNPLRSLGDLNIWLDSKDYGFVEIGHQFILHNIADRFNPSFK